MLEIISDFQNTIQVNGIFYDSLQTAVNAIENSSSKKGTILIWDDIVNITSGVTIPDNADVTISLEGHIVQFRNLSFAIINNGILKIIDFEDVNDSEIDTQSSLKNSTGTTIKNNGTLFIGQEGNANSNSPSIEGVQPIYGNEAEIKSGRLVTINNGEQTGALNQNSFITLADSGEDIRIVSVHPLLKLLAGEGALLRGTVPNRRLSSAVEIISAPMLPEWTNDRVITTLNSSAYGILNIYSNIDESQTRDISYTVEYYKDNEKVSADTQTESETIQVLETPILTVDKTKINTTNKYIGYVLDKTDPAEIPDIINNEDTIKVYYKKGRYNYTVEYYYDGIKNSEKTETIEATYQDVISTYTDKNITGYKLDHVDRIPLTVTENEDSNVIKVYYIKDNFDYTVEYYYDGTKNAEKTDTIEATYQDVISTYTDKNITGYKLDHVEGTPLTITENEDSNVIKVYYVKDKFNYTVEYYYDGTKNAEKTDMIEATYQDVISTYTDKNINGYRLQKVEGIPLTITEDESTNLIKVYYIIDDENTIEISYTVEYYRDNTLVASDTQTETATVQVLQPYVLTVDKTKINTTNKYIGYVFDKTEPAEIPDTINDGDTIKVYYKKGTFNYTVEYYYDGIKNAEKTDTVEATYQDVISTYTDKNITGYKLDHVDGTPLTITENENSNVIKVYYVKDKFNYTVEYYYDGTKNAEKTDVIEATYQDVISTYTDKNITGYKFDHVDGTPLTVTENEDSNVIKVYYIKDKFDYTVEYYYDGIKNAEKTDVVEATYQDVISTYIDKNIEGYKLQKVEGTPLTIGTNEEENIIKVYYIIDDENTKELKYYVEYYKDNEKVEDDTQTESITVQTLQANTMTVDKSKINLINKYVGYKLDKTEPTPIPDMITSESTIKVYYVKDKFDYTVEYYYDGTKNAEKTDVIESTYQDVISTYTDKNITGYKLDHVDGIPLTITENEETNIIKVYYVPDPEQTKDLKYTVEYYISGDLQNDDTDEVHQTVQELVPNTLEVKKDDINTEDKYVGYKLEKILLNDNEEPLEELPDTVNNNDVIKIFYVLDDTKTREIKYTVKYYKDEELQEDDTQTVRKVVHVLDGDTLDVNVDDINITDKYEGYTFEKTVPARIPNIAVDGEVIEVYYVKTKYPYTVEYYYNNIKDNTLTGTGEAHKDDVIENYENKVKEGYEFEEVVGIPLTISDTEENVIKVYYLPIRNLTVQHIDKNTGEVLETEEKHGKEGYTVTTSAKDIEEYMLVEIPSTEEYTYSSEDQVVKYYYAKVSSGVLEKHIDLITGNPIVEDEFYEGYEGKHYETNTKELEGYKISTNKELYQSIVKESPEFLSDAGYESLIDFFEGTGIVTTDNYVPENAEGEMEEELITVRYYYTPIIKLIVKYKDILTGEEIEENIEGELISSTIIETGNLSEPYTTISKIFENYIGISNRTFYRMYLTNHPEVLEEAEVETVDEYLEKENIDPKAPYVPENSEGTYEIILNDDGTYSNEILVTYYYGVEREVRIKFYDKNTGEEISEEIVKVGPDGDPYDVTEDQKELEGYTLIEIPENPEGTYEEENEPRSYCYAKNTQVQVKYIDKETGNEIENANYEIEGYEGKSYETEPKVFNDYELEETIGATEGTMLRDPIQVTYYYRKLSSPTENTITNDVINNTIANNTITNEAVNNTISNITNTTNSVSYTVTNTTSNTVTNTSSSTTIITTKDPEKNTSTSNTTSNNIIKRIVNPKTGDMVPVVAYTTIFAVLVVNIILARYNRVKLTEVSRVSRISRTKEMKTQETNKIAKHDTKKRMGRG